MLQQSRIAQLFGIAILAGSLGGCKGKDRDPADSQPVEVAPRPCEGGRSDDPPRGQLIEAHRLFRAQRYAEARSFLDKLLEEKPNSVAALVLRGDAKLYDESLGERGAALQARADYERASSLVDEGCRTRRRSEYYLRMGQALTALRLAATETPGQFDGGELERAETILRQAEERWPESAEVHYHRARVACARGVVDECVGSFARALEIAESLTRPRFLRVHRSSEDWIVRSESQSEFAPLRRDPRYEKVINDVRSRKPRPSP